jgi:alpha-D-xyloside xylohydrolase
MRPLVMDFNGDTAALNQRFEYMFGKALLVAPVTEPNVEAWKVYLPGSAAWYDFWSGKRFAGGRTTEVSAPLDRIPLMVKAGSIIPMGPSIQYSTERNDPVEIRIYPGADGEFTLYEDENDGYDYEKALYSTIEFKLNDSVHEITIGKRRGDFPGMLKTRTFNVVVVSPDHGTGVDVTNKVDKIVKYDGTETEIVLH